MLTQYQPPRPRAFSFERQLVWVYGWTCRLLFGKTLSVMAGEAERQGKWYGCPCTHFINWLLCDPCHCENELRHAIFESGT